MLLLIDNAWFDQNTAAPTSGDEVLKTGEARNAAFALLVDRHGRLMYRIAFSLLRHSQDAEDAVQEMLLKLYRGDAWQKMRDEKLFLARSVWRVALDMLPERREILIEETHEQIADRRQSPESDAIRSIESERLRAMIDLLPEDLRRVLVLSAIDDLNSREVGELLSLPEGTVRTRLMRARDELRRRFVGRHGNKL